jgi:hypothetical protein
MERENKAKREKKESEIWGILSRPSPFQLFGENK